MAHVAAGIVTSKQARFAELALAIGAFAIGTGEFAAMGFLPSVADGLGVTIPEAGRNISAYALGVVVGAPLIAVLGAKLSRRALLLVLMSLFAAGNLASALAPNFVFLLGLRFASGLPHGAYFGVAALVAAGMAGSAGRGRAVARVMLGLSDDANSSDAARLLAEVKEATAAAELAAETARKHALDPVLSGDDLKLARREMDDGAFKRDRLQEASAKLTERVEALKALEADGRLQAEHERVLDERDRLAEEMERMADPIAQIAHLVRQIEACDREIGRLNATSAAKFGHIRIVLSGAAPATTTLFQDALVWDTFIAVARLQTPPAAGVRGRQTANATDARHRPS